MGDTPDRERGLPMENLSGVKKKSKRKENRDGTRCGLEFKLRCVKLRLEEGSLVISIASGVTGQLRTTSAPAPWPYMKYSQKCQGIRG
jgi:hypothetical protein